MSIKTPELLAPHVQEAAVPTVIDAVDTDVVAPIDPAERIKFWGLGRLEAIITVLNTGDTKERLEEAVLTCQIHPRNNELLTLNEQGDLDVIRLRYESWTSLQALITQLKVHNVTVDSIRFADHGKTSQA